MTGRTPSCELASVPDSGPSGYSVSNAKLGCWVLADRLWVFASRSRHTVPSRERFVLTWLTVRRIARCRRRLPRVPTPSQHPPKFNEPDIIALCKWFDSPPVWCCAQIIQVRILKEIKKK